MEEISETQKKQILKDLVNDEEIVMLYCRGARRSRKPGCFSAGMKQNLAQ